VKAVFYIGGPLILMTFAFIGGLLVNIRAKVREALLERGFSKRGAENYSRAVKLLNRITRITDLDGAFSEDVLSESTKKEIGEILATYRKDVSSS
jgi:hypothetical protein